ncbi:GATA transcription factor [Melia azedarach]|uniref:GATA transcription factor n=1 Tax=Melia azedarach TaxID=155640 RepID=A0ACC1YKZ4_MELAZ|nr:GATA transcription factor [Melia azedarach]
MIMDSQWFNQEMNGCDHSNAGKKIDLTLKLGLPNCDENNQQPHIGQHLDFDQIMTPHHASLEGINQYEMLNEGMNFSAKEIPSNFRSQFIHPQYNYQQPSNINNMNGSSYGGFSSFSSSSNNPYYHPHHYTYNNNSSNFNMNPNANLLPPPGAVMNDYTLLDIPSRRADRELGIGSSSRRKVGMRRQRGGGFIDPFKRCTNYNCNTNDTPMWRRGPLGPKTLCNACGIKYRKEEEKRKAKEAEKSNSQEDSDNQSA